MDTDESVIELTIKAEGKGLENTPKESMHMSSSSKSASLRILSVEDDKGNNLLREEKCGKERNTTDKGLNILAGVCFICFYSN